MGQPLLRLTRLILIVAIASPFTVDAQTSSVVILPVQAQGPVTRELRTRFEDALHGLAVTSLPTSGAWNVVPAEVARKAFFDVGLFPWMCRHPMTCALSMAPELGASAFLSATVERRESTFVARLELIDTWTGRRVATGVVEGADMDELQTALRHPDGVKNLGSGLSGIDRATANRIKSVERRADEQRRAPRSAVDEQPILPRIHLLGALSENDVGRIIRRHWNEIKYCYELSLMEKPGLQGRVLLSFHIGPAGEVQEPFIRESELKSERAEACILKQAGQWVFPKPVGGREVEVNYPFIFDHQ